MCARPPCGASSQAKLTKGYPGSGQRAPRAAGCPRGRGDSQVCIGFVLDDAEKSVRGSGILVPIVSFVATVSSVRPQAGRLHWDPLRDSPGCPPLPAWGRCPLTRSHSSLGIRFLLKAGTETVSRRPGRVQTHGSHRLSPQAAGRLEGIFMQPPAETGKRSLKTLHAGL